MSKKIDIKTAPINSLLLKLSIPAFLGIVVNLLFNFIDGIFIGKGIGSQALGGVTVVFPIVLIIIAVSTMFGEGAASIVARAVAVEDTKKAARTIGQANTMAILVLAIVTIFTLINVQAAMRLLGARGALTGFAAEYYKAMIPGIFFTGLSLIYFYQLNAQGEIRIATRAMALSTLVNIVLDYIAIYLLDMGVAGAGYATSIAQIVWFFSMHIGANSKSYLVKSWLPFSLKLDFSLVKEIITLGLGSFIRQVGVGAALILINSVAGSYGGEIHIACFGAAQRIIRLGITPVAAVSTAFKTIAGQNFGAGNYRRVKEVVKKSFIVTIILGVAATALIIAARGFLGGLFGIPAEHMEIFTTILIITSCVLSFYGIFHIAVAYFTASGQPKQAIVLNILKQFVILVPLIFILPYRFGLYGVFAGIPLADIASIAIALILIRINYQKVLQ